MAKEIDDDDGMPQFVDFISRMLRWRPEDRTTAQDLLSHPWPPQMKPRMDENGLICTVSCRTCNVILSTNIYHEAQERSRTEHQSATGQQTESLDSTPY